MTGTPNSQIVKLLHAGFKEVEISEVLDIDLEVVHQESKAIDTRYSLEISQLILNIQNRNWMLLEQMKAEAYMAAIGSGEPDKSWFDRLLKVVDQQTRMADRFLKNADEKVGPDQINVTFTNDTNLYHIAVDNMPEEQQWFDQFADMTPDALVNSEPASLPETIEVNPLHESD